MRRVVCFGEALIDLLNTDQIQDGKLSLNSFVQYPGGAPANAAVAVAKLGGTAFFAGQVGSDPFGQFLIDALELYGVDTSFTLIHPDAPTALAFVFLDDKGERSFSFRRDQTADIVITRDQVRQGWFDERSIVHFCSNTLTDGSIADVTRHVVFTARRQGAIVSFDVNLRHNLWQAGAADTAVVNDLVGRADLVKFSAEEIDYLSEGHRDAYLDECFDAGLTTALVTDGPGEIEIHWRASRARISPPPVEAVDTTGGGDAFIGAVLYGLARQSDPLAYLRDSDRLPRLIRAAASCGALAVTRRGAFPSFPTSAEIEDDWDV